MIGRLTGLILEKLPPQIVLEVNGVGYELDVPMSTFYDLPHPGDKVTLFTHYVVREDAHLLYGFASRSERETFRQLLKISGIGAKTALAILSGMNADELALAVAGEDVARLARVPGIGKKTAERLILELRGKLGRRGWHSRRADEQHTAGRRANRPWRYRQRLAGAGLQRPRSSGGVERVAGRGQRQRWHPAGA